LQSHAGIVFFFQYALLEMMLVGERFCINL